VIAVAQHRLGMLEDARSNLKQARIRAGVSDTQGDYAVAQSLIREAEQLIEGTSSRGRKD
jgi:hypothetical protein